MANLSEMSAWSAPVIIGSVTLFNLAARLVERAYPILFPTAYKRLSATSSPVKIQYMYCYFVSYFVLFFIQAPACYLALKGSSTPKTESSPIGPGEICIGGRALIWAAELPYLGHHNALWLHHFFALVSLVLMLFTNAPGRQFYVVYLSLINEVFGKVAATLSLHGIDKTRPSIVRGLQTAAVVSLWTLRIPVILWLLYDACFATDVPSPVPLAASCFYLGTYTIYLAWKQGKRLGLYDITDTKPACFRLGSMSWTLFEVCFKVSLALLMMSTSALYSFGSAQSHRRQLPTTLWLGSLMVTYIGLRSAAWASRYLHTRNMHALSRHHYWYEGGLSITSVLAWALVHYGPESVDSTSFLGALAMSTLLLEAGVHIGCRFDEGPDPDRGTQSNSSHSNVTAHTLSSLAATCTYGFLLVLLFRHDMTLGEAGAVAMATRGIMRLLLYTFEHQKSVYLLLHHTTLSFVVLAALCESDENHIPTALIRAYSYLTPGLSSAMLVVSVKYLARVTVFRQLTRWLCNLRHLAILGSIAITIATIYLAPTVKTAGDGQSSTKFNETTYLMMENPTVENYAAPFPPSAAILTVLAGVIFTPSSFLTRVQSKV
ncbi:hypothetical protein SCUP234_10818 [Seiridium cupressi]